MVTIAIPTYNRINIVKMMASSLYDSNLPDFCNIRIYDDFSTDYDLNLLKTIFPNAASYNINERNYGADKNLFNFYKYFLDTSDDYLFNADSDLIFNKDWVQKSLYLIQKTDGILTILNAASHPSINKLDDDFCIKEHIGAAGTLFTKSRVKEIVDYFIQNKDDGEYSFDWKWSEYFYKNNVRLFCTNNSLVQHIGYTGQNSLFFYDYGKYFKVDTLNNGQIINDIFEKYSENVQFIGDYYKNSIKYNFSRLIINFLKIFLPLKLINILKKKFYNKHNA